MKFSCDSSVLQKGINIVEKAVSQRSSLPVLENIFFQIEGGKLRLRGNDLEIGIENLVSVDSEQTDGSVLIKAKTISSIVSKLQNQKVNIQVDGRNKVLIKSDGVDYDILGTGAEDYPVFPDIESGTSFSLKAGVLRDLIRYTIYAVSFDETKQFLNGILVKSEGNYLRFVATDGYRLAIKRVPFEGHSDFSMIVPYKSMNELSKILQQIDSDEEVQVTVSDNQFAVRVSEVVLVSRVIQGQFPDYNQVVPKEANNKFGVSRRLFVDASERASIIASSSNNVVRLSFGSDSLTIMANASALGEFKEDLPLTPIEGEGNAKIAFNVRLILDAIKHLEGDDVTIAFNNELSPCVIRPASGDDFIYIIMPIRTSDYQAA